ncbi:addiction module antidote protein [Stenotrophomonas oahuensis]|uniref:addiction module antidote protein n=1 Tax=Stenotrophomonas oahuensis TaxID=3003271 RepID=UPI003CCD0F7A
MPTSSKVSPSHSPAHSRGLPEPLRGRVTQGNRGEVLEALGDLARQHGMVVLADEIGLTRLTLYKSLRSDGNPKLTTILAVLEGLGLELRIVPAKRRNTTPA